MTVGLFASAVLTAGDYHEFCTPAPNYLSKYSSLISNSNHMLEVTKTKMHTITFRMRGYTHIHRVKEVKASIHLLTDGAQKEKAGNNPDRVISEYPDSNFLLTFCT